MFFNKGNLMVSACSGRAIAAFRKAVELTVD